MILVRQFSEAARVSDLRELSGNQNEARRLLERRKERDSTAGRWARHTLGGGREFKAVKSAKPPPKTPGAKPVQKPRRAKQPRPRRRREEAADARDEGQAAGSSKPDG